jgi:hypothetical protein
MLPEPHFKPRAALGDDATHMDVGLVLSGFVPFPLALARLGSVCYIGSFESDLPKAAHLAMPWTLAIRASPGPGHLPRERG